MRIWDRYLSYTPKRNSVVLCDLATGRTAEVARAKAPGEMFDYAVGSGDKVVYAVLSGVPNADRPVPVKWRLEVLDLGSGKRRRLDEFSVTYAGVPRPMAAGRWVLWTRPTVSGTSVVTFDHRTGRTRIVASGERKAGNAGVSEGGLVAFDGEGPSGSRQVFVTPADGTGAARPITDHAAVRPIAVANGRVAWRDTPAGGPEQRWTTAIGSDEPPRSVDAMARVVPGADFMVAEVPVEGDLPRLAVHDVNRPGTSWPLLPENERVDLGSYWDVSGDLIAWVSIELDSAGQVKRHLRLARVVRGP